MSGCSKEYDYGCRQPREWGFCDKDACEWEPSSSGENDKYTFHPSILKPLVNKYVFPKHPNDWSEYDYVQYFLKHTVFTNSGASPQFTVSLERVKGVNSYALRKYREKYLEHIPGSPYKKPLYRWINNSTC